MMEIDHLLVVVMESLGAEEEQAEAEETMTGEDRQARVHPGEGDGT